VLPYKLFVHLCVCVCVCVCVCLCVHFCLCHMFSADRIYKTHANSHSHVFLLRKLGHILKGLYMMIASCCFRACVLLIVRTGLF
jgi:hypothetical protein